jgi:hypothetical protein
MLRMDRMDRASDTPGIHAKHADRGRQLARFSHLVEDKAPGCVVVGRWSNLLILSSVFVDFGPPSEARHGPSRWLNRGETHEERWREPVIEIRPYRMSP